jgi:hypothetical protein
MAQKEAGNTPAAKSVLGRIQSFLEGAKVGSLAGSDKNVASLLRQFKYTFREYWAKLYGLRVEEGTAYLFATHRDAELVYIRLLEDTPGREVGLYQNATTGEYAVIQGKGNFVGGEVSHARNANIAGPNDWFIVEHYHPERNFAVPYPSMGLTNQGGLPVASGDFAVLLLEHGETNPAAIFQGAKSNVVTGRVESRIRYRDPKTGNYSFTTFAYDRNHSTGQFIVIAEGVENSFESVAEYHQAIAKLETSGIKPHLP